MADLAFFVPKLLEDRLRGKKLIVVLDQAHLQLGMSKNREFRLLNSQDDKIILKRLNKTSEEFRPDILHQCLLCLLESPLNRSGRLNVFVRTQDNQLIEISPQLTVPRTWIQFEYLMINLLTKRNIKAKEMNVTLMKFIKNNLENVLPAGCHKIGLSVSGEQVNLPNFVESNYKKTEIPVAIFVGCVAKSDPASKENCPLLEKALKISKYSLTAAVLGLAGQFATV